MLSFRPLSYLLPFVLASCVQAQSVPPELRTGHAPLDKRLARMITADDRAIGAAAAREMAGAVYLDARETEEYNVSHLPAARHLGYDRMDPSVVADLDRATPLVVYCTVGYRSERAAAELRRAGFTRVYNLYGSLYAWRLAGFPLEDAAGEPTDRVHTYNRKWGTFVPDSIGEKVH